jgi:hypothetical protein
MDELEVTELYVASYLNARGFPVLRLAGERGRRVFHFAPEAREAALAFFNGAVIEARPPWDLRAVEAFREFGRQGGKKGGKARMAGLTPRERQELARKAIQARWERYRKAKARRTK